jgi:Ca2+-binding EF-hand superfamily protein
VGVKSPPENVESSFKKFKRRISRIKKITNTLTALTEKLSDEQCKALIEMITVFSLGDSFTADEIKEIRLAMSADENEYVDFES